MMLSLAPCVQAEKADRDKPIELVADTLFMDQLGGITTAQGHVIVTQGTMKVHADHVTVTRDAQGNETLVATGKRVMFRQRADQEPNQTTDEIWIEAQGRRLDYATTTHIAILTGNARVKKGENTIVGDVITYNTETQVVESTGGAPTTANKGRVTVILPPQTTRTTPSPAK